MKNWSTEMRLTKTEYSFVICFTGTSSLLVIFGFTTSNTNLINGVGMIRKQIFLHKLGVQLIIFNMRCDSQQSSPCLLKSQSAVTKIYAAHMHKIQAHKNLSGLAIRGSEHACSFSRIRVNFVLTLFRPAHFPMAEIDLRREISAAESNFASCLHQLQAYYYFCCRPTRWRKMTRAIGNLQLLCWSCMQIRGAAAATFFAPLSIHWVG
jgi:hypothetical protein